MLYKKYHRNYVRQFKKGVKLLNRNEVTKEPYLIGRSIEIEVNRYILTIVSASGKIHYREYLYVV